MPDFEPAQTANLMNPADWNMSFPSSTFHSSYHPLPEIDSFISDLAKEHSDLVELISIGRTSEQREMTVVKISDENKSVPGKKNGEPLKSKGAVVMMGAQHAREVRFPRGYLGHAQLLISPPLPSGLRFPQLCTSLMGSSQILGTTTP